MIVSYPELKDFPVNPSQYDLCYISSFENPDLSGSYTAGKTYIAEQVKEPGGHLTFTGNDNTLTASGSTWVGGTSSQTLSAGDIIAVRYGKNVGNWKVASVTNSSSIELAGSSSSIETDAPLSASIVLDSNLQVKSPTVGFDGNNIKIDVIDSPISSWGGSLGSKVEVDLTGSGTEVSPYNVKVVLNNNKNFTPPIIVASGPDVTSLTFNSDKTIVATGGTNPFADVKVGMKLTISNASQNNSSLGWTVTVVAGNTITVDNSLITNSSDSNAVLEFFDLDSSTSKGHKFYGTVVRDAINNSNSSGAVFSLDNITNTANGNVANGGTSITVDDISAFPHTGEIHFTDSTSSVQNLSYRTIDTNNNQFLSVAGWTGAGTLLDDTTIYATDRFISYTSSALDDVTSIVQGVGGSGLVTTQRGQKLSGGYIIEYKVPTWSEKSFTTSVEDSNRRVKDKLLKTQYLAKDFNTYMDEALSYMKKQFPDRFNDYVTSDTGIMLLEAVAYMLDSLAFYVDLASNENFITTAKLKSSVLRLSKYLGYKSHGAVASSVDLSITLGATYGFDTVFPIGHQVESDSGIIYEFAEALTITAGDTATKTVTATEGVTRTATFVSSGLSNQVFEIEGIADGEWIVDGSVSMSVDGVSWSYKDKFVLDDSLQFEFEYNESPPFGKTGDGVIGFIPPINSQIVVTYRVGKGVAGMVKSGTINTGSSFIYNATTINYTVSNTNPSTGGANPETMDSIRNNAPSVFSTTDRAVSQGDWDTLATNFEDATYGKIAIAKAVLLTNVDYESTLDSYLTNQISLTESLKTVMTSYLDVQQNFSNATFTIPAWSSNVILLPISYDLEKDMWNTYFPAGIKSIQAEYDQNLFAVRDLGMPEIWQGNLEKLEPLKQYLVSNQTTEDITITLPQTPEYPQGVIYFEDLDLNGDGVINTSDLLEWIELGNTANAEFVSNIIQGVSEAPPHAPNPETYTGGGYLYPLPDPQVVLNQFNSKIQGIEGLNTHIRSQIESLFSENMVNHVIVYCLAHDADGNYVNPSSGLRNALKNYLDERKLATTTFEVIGGASNIIKCNITSSISVKKEYKIETVISNVKVALNTLLKDRPFGHSLYKADVYKVVNSVDGVVYSDNTIDTISTSHKSKIDSGGNLIISDREVVAKGDLVDDVYVSALEVLSSETVMATGG